MNNKQSKKHHYLPRHYLKGFVDNKNMFYVYDKKTNKIFKSNPDASFFQNNLNTIKVTKGKSSDVLEKLYASIENHSWAPFDRIRNSNKNTSINPLDKANVYLFLLFLHWRLPSNFEYVNQMTNDVFSDNTDLDYLKFQYEDGKEAPKAMKDMLQSSSAFKKMMRLLVPFAPFYKNKDWMNNLAKWRFLYTGDTNNWFIVGDNPIITEGINDHDSLKCLDKFLFPISGKILLINTPRPIDKSYPPDFILLYSAAIIERSKRFVACQNENFLKSLFKYYNVFVEHKKTNTILPELFNLLKY